MKSSTVRTLTAALAVGLFAASAQAQLTTRFIERSKAWGSVVADFNKDGHQDFFICGHDLNNDRIWYWTATGYVPGDQIFESVDRHDCDAADVNGDGRIDLYCAVGGDKGNSTSKSNELYLQRVDGTFALQKNFGAEDPYGRSRIPVFFDLNHDGKPDIYLTNLATPRTDGQPNYNHVYLNQGSSKFAEVVTTATGGFGQQCAVKGDIDGDGWDDLVVCYEKGAPSLFVNNHANDFTKLAITQFKDEWQDAKLVDLDGDGFDDLVVITAADSHLQVWMNIGKAPWFKTKALDDQLPGRGVSVAVSDLNKDGLKDFYVVLQDKDCQLTGHDTAPDVIYWGNATTGYTREVQTQAFDGCGHLADIVDGYKVLLENGGVNWFGPNYLINWVK